MHESIKAWCQDFPVTEVYPPIGLDVNTYDSNIDDSLFPIGFQNHNTDVMICINMIHISPIQSTHSLFKLASHMIKPNGLLITYGPYKVDGFLVESNIQFDESLKSRNSEWGVRELNDLIEISNSNQLLLLIILL